MKTVIDAVNKYQGVWPDENLRELVTTDKSWDGGRRYTGRIEPRYDCSMGDNPCHDIDEKSWVVLCDRSKFNKCVDEMSKAEWIKSKPLVYTQEMSDNGVLPSVGMEYLREGGQVNKCLVNYGDFAIGLIVDHVKVNNKLPLTQTARGMCKPLTPSKTDTEKAIDSLNTFNLLQCKGWQDDLIEFIKSGEFHGVTFTGVK